MSKGYLTPKAISPRADQKAPHGTADSSSLKNPPKKFSEIHIFLDIFHENLIFLVLSRRHKFSELSILNFFVYFIFFIAYNKQETEGEFDLKVALIGSRKFLKLEIVSTLF